MSEVDEGQSQDINAKLNSEIESLKNQIASMNASWQQNMNTVVDAVLSSKQQQTETVNEDEDLSSISVKDFKNKILSEVTNVVEEKTAAATKKQQQLSSTIVKLSQDFPEIQNANSKLSKKMVEFHDSLPKHLKETPEGYEMALLKASNELGMVPVKQRRSGDEDFSFGGEGSFSGEAPKAKQKKIDPKTLQFAALMGMDINDKKVLESLQENSRDSWGKYK